MPEPHRNLVVIRLVELEGRVTPAFLGGVRVAVGDVTGDGVPDILAGAGPGGAPHVRAFSGTDGAEVHSFYAGSSLGTAGVSVAVGEFTGDLAADIVTADETGTVSIWDGPTAQPVRTFAAFDGGFSSAVGVATGDVTGDSHADIIVGAGGGGSPQVKVFDGQTGVVVLSFEAFTAGFTGGVNMAAGDLSGDGIADVVVGAGPGGGPNVAAFDGRTGQLFWSFFAFAPGFTGGVSVAVADVTGDRRADVVVGAGAGGGPQVTAFDGVSGGIANSFYAYDPAFRGGTSVAAGDLNWDGTADIITGAGAGGSPHVRAFDGKGRGSLASFFAFGDVVGGGIWSAPLDSTAPTLTLEMPASFVTANPTFQGVAGDLGSRVAAVEVSTDGGAFEPVPVSPGGRFAFTTSLPLTGVADGSHAVRFRATDRAGNVSATRTGRFTLDTRPPMLTDGPSGVLRTSPGTLTLTFSEPVVGVSADRFVLVRQPNQPIPVARVETPTPTTAVLHLTAPLPNGGYLLTIRDLTDRAGNPLTGRSAFTLTVAVPLAIAPVRVTAIGPADGESGVEPLADVVVSFDGEVDPATVTADGVFLFANGWRLPGSLRAAPNARSVLFRPTDPLPPDTEVRVVVDGSRLHGKNGLAVDADGNGLAGGLRVSQFRTRPEPPPSP